MTFCQFLARPLSLHFSSYVIFTSFYFKKRFRNQWPWQCKARWGCCSSRVGWKKVHRLTMMQWSNLNKCGLFFSIVSPAVHTRTSSTGVALLGFLWYRSSHPDPGKSPQLQIWPHHLSDIPSKPSVSSCWGTESSQMMPNQENTEGDQPVQSHSHTQQPLQPLTCVQEHCPGETGLPLSVFQAISEMSQIPLQVLNYLYPVWVYLVQGNNAVSIRKGWI